MTRLVHVLLSLLLLLYAPLARATDKGSVHNPPGWTPSPSIDLKGLPAGSVVRKQGPDGKPHQVEAYLLADRTAIRPGERFRLGVLLKQDKNWHTYWKSPGAVGKPTEIDWTGPEGVRFSPVQWPVPSRFELAGIVSYGYDDQVLFFTEVEVPGDLPLGEAVFGATAQARWLACEVQCIPGDAELTLRVPVVGPEASAGPSAYAALFDHYARLHPDPAATARGYALDVAWSQVPVRPGDEFKVALLFTPTGEVAIQRPEGVGSWPLLTPILTPGWMAMSDPQVEELPGGAVRLLVEGIALEPEAGKDGFGALVQVLVDGKPQRAEHVVPMPVGPAEAAVQANPSPIFDAQALARAAGADGPGASTPPSAPAPKASLPAMLGLAFLGGMLLNIMPCVLPVLTLKLYSLVEQADISAAMRRRAGLAYTAGIVLSFIALALVVVALKQSLGMDVGWGFQFQYPGFVIALGTIVFVFALNLFGVFEIPSPGASTLANASDREGVAGYFLTGAFATLLATPCSAPFLGTGMGFAFTLPAAGIVVFFAVAGLGLAAPFLLIAFLPGLFRFLPRPGLWMETFKQFMGFTLIATTVWLADVVASQTGREGATGFLIFLAAVGLGAWIYGRFGGQTQTGRRQALALAVAVAIAAFTGRNVLKTTLAADECAVTGPVTAELGKESFATSIPWQPFSEESVEALAGRTVFIDFTADWCLTCKVNEKNILETETVRRAMAEAGVVPLKADWTRRDETITKWLQRYGKAGVPFYLVIPADRSRPTIPLPEVITPETVRQAIAEAG